jgi:hypothetical protein
MTNIQTKELKVIDDLLADVWNKWILFHGKENDATTEMFRQGVHMCQGAIAIKELKSGARQ